LPASTEDDLNRAFRFPLVAVKKASRNVDGLLRVGEGEKEGTKPGGDGEDGYDTDVGVDVRDECKASCKLDERVDAALDGERDTTI
jgi:hypothetical protein